MSVDPMRHQSIFSPAEFGNKRVDVIGAGATGSAVALHLAKLGVSNLHVWDFDTVEAHNLANQVYGTAHIGMPKVEALKHIIKDFADIEITAHNEAVTKGMRLPAKFVFLLTDSMESRKDIGETLKLNFVTEAVIETRMGTESGFIFTFNPNKPRQYEQWAETLWEDAVAETSACGTAITVGATANLIAAHAVWQFIKASKGEELDNQIMVATRPYIIQTRQFKAA